VAGVQSPGAPGVQFVFQVSYPLVTGGTWALYGTTDGVTVAELEAGTYTVEGTPSHGVRGKTSAFTLHH
jgi:hypothetical protein